VAEQPENWVRIGNDHLSAAINPLGAELSSLCDAAGRELMTDADPAFWTGRAPLLFPVIGVTRDGIRLNGRHYPMAKHGFARHAMFEVVTVEPTRAVFSLGDSEETRASYPFAFRLEAEFRLEDATLVMDVRILNRGEVVMPASFGFHPAFAWPLPYGRARADHRITFEREEPSKLRVIAPDGQIAQGLRDSPLDGRVLHLADDLFTQDALVWDPVESRSLTYGADGAPQLRIAFPDTDKLGIWTKPGAAYVCVEPWHGIADPEGFDGDFAEKPGVFVVPVGGEKLIRTTVTLAG
jgi:galactose mutarotase-like enzyme